MLQVIINIAIMLVFVGILFNMQKKYVAFTKRVFLALGLGIVFGAVLQLVYGQGSQVITTSLEWFNIIGSGYVRLLKLIVTPLILVSIISSIVNMKGNEKGSVGKMSAYVIGILLFTAGIASLVSIVTSLGFGLTAEGLVAGAKESARAAALDQRMAGLANKSMINQIVAIIPTNPFAAMTGAGSSSTIGVVIFSAFIGIATRGIAKKKPAEYELAKNIISSAHGVVMRMVTLVLRLTPYGVLALMTKVTATSNVAEIAKLGKFVIATYLAMGIMFLIHLVMIAMVGLSPIKFLKKAWPVLTFAFTSRTSAGSIPLNVECQEKQLGVSEGIANMSAGFGSTIGQNGCAAIFPAMVAVMIAPTVGINPTDPAFLIKLVVVILISSFGVAGVGGGATFAALIVLSTMNMPVALVGLLISIEPLLDMGRTALNVSGAMTSGVISAKLLGQIDTKIYNSEQVELAKEEA